MTTRDTPRTPLQRARLRLDRAQLALVRRRERDRGTLTEYQAAFDAYRRAKRRAGSGPRKGGAT